MSDIEQQEIQQNIQEKQNSMPPFPLSDEEIIKQEKNKTFGWTKNYAATIFILNALLLVVIVINFIYSQKQIATLKEKNLKLKKEIGPLKDFHNQRDKMIQKELYDQQQEQILSLQQDKVELTKNLNHSKQMIVNLSRSLDDAQSLNTTLEDENKALDFKNKALTSELKYEKMKLQAKENNKDKDQE